MLRTLTAISRSHSSAVYSCSGLTWTIPAQLTTICRPPKRAAALSMLVADLFLAGDVAFDEDGLATGRPDGRFQLPAAIGLHVGDGDAGPFRRKKTHGRLADSRSRRR